MQFIDLKEEDKVFSDSRHYLDYSGDTLEVLKAMMQSEVVFIDTSIYQASITVSLKNVFDLLPIYALDCKVIGLMVIGGSPRHFLVVETKIKTIIHDM
ncbi:NADPH-dependent FMN reductase [Aerococcaceae bacterium WGS1372]